MSKPSKIKHFSTSKGETTLDARDDSKEVKTVEPPGYQLSISLPSSSEERLAFAIRTLQETGKATLRTRELSDLDRKLGYDSTVQPSYDFNPQVVAAMRGMLGNRVYRFILSRASSVTSGTGTLTINTSFNLTAWAEGGALTALFDECRMLSGNIQFAPASVGGGATNFAEYVCLYPSEDATTPTISIVTRIPNSIIMSPVYFSQPTTKVVWKIAQPRNWGLVTDEGVSSPRIVSGFNSTLKMIVAAGTPSNSTVYFGYLAKCIGEFRART